MILVIRRAIPSIQISSLARMDSILPHQPDGPGAAPLLLLSNICFISAGDGTLIEGAVLGRGGNDDVIGRGGCNASRVCLIVFFIFTSICLNVFSTIWGKSHVGKNY